MPNTRSSLDLADRDLCVITGSPGDGHLTPELVDAILRLRFDVFHTQLGWQVTSDNGRERDEFDSIPPQYIAVVDHDDRVLGTCRLLPTTGPYMIRDTFPAALGGLTPPACPNTWEMSRLAVAPGEPFAEGFGAVATAVINAALEHIVTLGGHTMLVFSHQDVERKIRRSGFEVESLAPPIRIEGKACTAYLLSAVPQSTW